MKEREQLVQKAWDEATNVYSRYPSAENWEAFLDCKRKVLSLREEAHKNSEKPAAVKKSLTAGEQIEIIKKTEDKIYDFLESVYPQIMTSQEIIKGCGITVDQMRHGLLKLLAHHKIEKIRTGYYQSIRRNE